MRELVRQVTSHVAQGFDAGQARLPSDPWGGFDGDSPKRDNPIITDGGEFATPNGLLGRQG